MENPIPHEPIIIREAANGFILNRRHDLPGRDFVSYEPTPYVFETMDAMVAFIRNYFGSKSE